MPGIFYNGYASSQTFGCASWLLISKTITVMFDVPRFSEPLARSISRKINPEHPVYIVLSHRDDVFGHEAWARRLGATRVIHHAEVNKKQGTNEVELKLTDSDFPYSLSEDDDVQLLHVPGHTPGSVALLDRVSKSIFTGDHLFFSNSYGKLMGSPVYIWHSWRLQIESVRMLKNVDFLHAFPGHGRAFHFVDDQERRHGIEQAAEYMATLSSVRL